MRIIHRPDGLRYTVAEQLQPDIATFCNEEVLLLYSHRPVPDEITRALIRIKQMFPGARVVAARGICPI